MQQKASKAMPKYSAISVLVVDDYSPFRTFIVSLLTVIGNTYVVGEVSDGTEAVQKAVELKPDLILLDIGLPTLNGIQAGRQIRELAPDSKIIFLSQESSPDVVEEAFSLGAQGYVVKVRAASELRDAVQSVISGQRFVGEIAADGNSGFAAEAP
jgi:DNA-binding NarL/FixJ family response regulator